MTQLLDRLQVGDVGEGTHQREQDEACPNEPRSPASPRDTEDRCLFATGTFFASVPEGADAYLLCGVLHDWNDERAAAILRSCRQAMPKNGRLLIIETIVPETNSASFSKLLDVNMMVMTCGRERTKSEFQVLLSRAGFRIQRVTPTLAPHSIIEAIQSE